MSVAITLRATAVRETGVGNSDQGGNAEPLLRRGSERVHPYIAGSAMRDALWRVSPTPGSVGPRAGVVLALGPHLHRGELHRQGGRATGCPRGPAGERRARYATRGTRHSGRGRELRLRSW